MKYRLVHDTLGKIKIPADKYWGAQTQRSLENFKIGPKASMPIEIIEAYGYIKKAAAISNHQFGLLTKEKKDLIVKVCDEIISGELSEHFPLVIWQTGSGTHTNMNCNEVISNRAQLLTGKSITQDKNLIHPNNDANKSQSSNDTFSAAMHIAAYKIVNDNLIPEIKRLKNTLQLKTKDFWDIVKVGRTHFMDAVPIRLGQEFSGYAEQIHKDLSALKSSLTYLSELALGGTAVGTGINTPIGFDKEIVSNVSRLTGFPFKPGNNKFALISNHNAIIQAHSALKQLSISLMKISNDIRLMVSGPYAGLNELKIPANEQGSSIMPGKVNPTQVEALTMVCSQVMGNDVTISVANSNGHFELNTFKPVIIANFLQSANLLSDAIKSFNDNCLLKLQPNLEKINSYIEKSLMLVTALAPHIGYENAAKIANKAYKEEITLKQAAVDLGLVSEEQFDKWTNPDDLTGPNIAKI